MTKMRNALMGIAVIGFCTQFVPLTGAAIADTEKRPVLTEFISQVTQDHPALKASEAALSAARARARGRSRPVYNPELAVGYENGEVNTKEVGISKAFDWSGKRRARRGVGEAEVRAAEASYELARKNLIATILHSLDTYQAAQRNYRVASDRKDLSVKFLALAKRQSDAGEMPRADYLTARLALAEARVAKNEAAGELSLAREKLVATVGSDRGSWPILRGTPSRTAVSTENVNIDLLAEMRLAQAQTEISRARIRMAKTDRKADPTVGLRVGEEGNSSLVGLSVSMPLRVLNTGKAEVQAAGSDLVAAQQAFFTVSRQIRASVTASQNRYNAVSQAWQEWQENGAEPLDEQRALLEKLLEAREISAVNYLVQLNQTFATEKAAIDLHSRLWHTWFNWQDASGQVGEWLETVQ